MQPLIGEKGTSEREMSRDRKGRGTCTWWTRVGLYGSRREAVVTCDVCEGASSMRMSPRVVVPSGRSGYLLMVPCVELSVWWEVSGEIGANVRVSDSCAVMKMWAEPRLWRAGVQRRISVIKAG